jgi:DNA-binding CsgD family transcriptional regulator
MTLPPRTRFASATAAHAYTRRVPSKTDDWTIPSEALLALFTANNLEALIDTAFHVLRASVVCDFASAFYRSAGNGLLKQRDSRGREYGPAFMRRYIELTPAIPLAVANRGMRIQATRTGLPGSTTELRRSPFYREIMQQQGWRHAVALLFWGDTPSELPTFVASVYRVEGKSDFSEQDIARLDGIHPFLDCAVNRIHEREAAKTMRDGIAMAVRDGTPGFAILDRNLLLVEANPVARQLCAAWVDDAVGADTETPPWHLPPVLQTACRDLHHEWQALLRADPDATGIRRARPVLHPRVPGLTAWIALVCPQTADLAEPTFVVEIERCVHGMALDTQDRSVPVLQKMTVGERAVAMVLADGFSNQEIADQLGKTVGAVKFLLHRIYQKTGIPSRAALVAVLRARSNRRARKRLAERAT